MKLAKLSNKSPVSQLLNIEPPKTYGLGIKFDENLTKEFPYKEKINTMILTDKEDIGLK